MSNFYKYDTQTKYDIIVGLGVAISEDNDDEIKFLSNQLMNMCNGICLCAADSVRNCCCGAITVDNSSI